MTTLQGLGSVDVDDLYLSAFLLDNGGLVLLGDGELRLSGVSLRHCGRSVCRVRVGWLGEVCVGECECDAVGSSG